MKKACSSPSPSSFPSSFPSSRLRARAPTFFLRATREMVVLLCSLFFPTALTVATLPLHKVALMLPEHRQCAELEVLTKAADACMCEIYYCFLGMHALMEIRSPSMHPESSLGSGGLQLLFHACFDGDQISIHALRVKLILFLSI